MSSTKPDSWEIDGQTVKVSSLDRLYWPDAGLTKGDLLDYYQAVARVMLRYLTQHPVTLNMFPRGAAAGGHYRRALPKTAPDWLTSVTYEPESRRGELIAPLIDTEAALIWHANQGAIEIHQWLSSANDLEQPDWAVFDLDPGEGVSFSDVLKAATIVRATISAAGLTAFPKTSGGSGVHIFVPLDPVAPFEQVREWVLAVARELAQEHPDLIAVASGATHRDPVVTIDHAQNSVARNIAAPYTARATPTATVSTPLTWDEVEAGGVRPGDFTITKVPQRLTEVGDLWQDARKKAGRIPD